MRTPVAVGTVALVVLVACRPTPPKVLVWEGEGEPHTREVAAAMRGLETRAPGVRAGTWGESKDATFELLEVEVAEQPHVHETHDLTVVILAGKGTLVAGGRRYYLTAGDVTHIGRGRPHYFQPDISNQVKGLAIFTPRLNGRDWKSHSD